MINPVPIELNLNNLKDVFEKIICLETFIFYGTLLGYQRNGNIIPNDDDVDIFINFKQLDLLLEALDLINFKVKIMPTRSWFSRQKKPLIVQATRVQKGIPTFVDFYLYDDEPIDHLEEKWNFLGQWKNPMTALHIPKHLIFPIQDVYMQGININIPAYPEKTCEFLYGSGWKTPLKKNEQYTISIENHVPVLKMKSKTL